MFIDIVNFCANLILCIVVLASLVVTQIPYYGIYVFVAICNLIFTTWVLNNPENKSVMKSVGIVVQFIAQYFIMIIEITTYYVSENDFYFRYMYVLLFIFITIFYINGIICHCVNKKKTKILLITVSNNITSQCSICLEHMNNQKGVILNDCKHAFHEECIAEWFKRQETCPNCRCRV